MKTNYMNGNNASISTYLFGWIAIFFGQFTLDDWAIIIGMVATILGLLITWYYQKRRDKREERKLEFEMKCYQNQNKDFIVHEPKTKK